VNSDLALAKRDPRVPRSRTSMSVTGETAKEISEHLTRPRGAKARRMRMRSPLASHTGPDLRTRKNAKSQGKGRAPTQTLTGTMSRCGEPARKDVNRGGFIMAA
jgi:hypothetical protein